jgi:hypothetical protein
MKKFAFMEILDSLAKALVFVKINFWPPLNLQLISRSPFVTISIAPLSKAPWFIAG